MGDDVAGHEQGRRMTRRRPVPVVMADCTGCREHTVVGGLTVAAPGTLAGYCTACGAVLIFDRDEELVARVARQTGAPTLAEDLGQCVL